MAKRRTKVIIWSSVFIGIAVASAFLGYRFSSIKDYFSKIEYIDAPKYEDDGNLRTWTDSVDNQRIFSFSNKYLKSTGNQKILVVPVSFKDDNYDGFNNVPTLRNKTYSETLEDAFFGDGKEIFGWESVKSFYEKSSYSKLTIDGEVTNTVYIDNTISYYSNLLQNSNNGNSITLSSVTNDLTETIMTSVFDNNPDIDFSEYDQNSDGYLDAIWFIYNSKYISNSKLAWAFTTSNGRSQNNLKYKIGVFSWGSYFFMEEGKYNNLFSGFYPDAHTYIHETGHLLGLDDYYSYANSSDNHEYPVGGLDMMDYNIGDHMAFSKYLLEWITPKQIIGEGTFTLKPFESSGEAYIISNNFNGTAFDEYLILEYYTPTGLNYKDASSTYAGNHTSMFKVPGLRIYHVDARTGYFKGSTLQGGYLNEVSNYGEHGTKTGIVNSNTSTNSHISTNNRLVELVSARNNGDIEEVTYPVAEDKDLYRKGDTLNKYFFNDGSSIPYSITVENITNDGLIVLIQK